MYCDKPRSQEVPHGDLLFFLLAIHAIFFYILSTYED